VIVYESMFGNTHEIAEAIRDGVREAAPDAELACLPVAEANPELGRGARTAAGRLANRCAHVLARVWIGCSSSDAPHLPVWIWR
jgi:hypothetical protein